MFPKGLTVPARDAIREAPPSDTRPADYPARIPFVVNQAMFYAASDDLATCSWHVLPAGERPVDRTARPSHAGLLGTLGRMREVLGATADFLPLDRATQAILDDLFDRVLAAAAGDDWTLHAAAPAAGPPGGRRATLTRPGERMEIMALLSPFGSVVSAWSFSEPVA
jgi:hypothetical protein